MCRAWVGVLAFLLPSEHGGVGGVSSLHVPDTRLREVTV